jgi:two-component system response regulator MprA
MAEDKGPVLVVDDEPDIVEFLTTVLRDEGYATESARDGLDALARLDEVRPALMILDLMMPRMTGNEVLTQLRASAPATRPRIIILSAKSTHEDIVDALENGADDFIPKPFDLEDLLLRVRVWLERGRPAEIPTATLRVFTLSPFRVLMGDELLLDEDSGSGQMRALLKYVVNSKDEPLPRSQVIYHLWPDLDQDEAERQLSALLQTFRRMTRSDLPNHDFVVESGGELYLNPDADVWVDAFEFETNVTMAQAAQEAGDVDIALGLYLSALALYKEDYLRENLYEDWPSDRREKLREMWINSMFRVSAMCADRCEYTDSVRLMKKILEIDPYRENAYQALMLYLSRAGRRGEAIQLYRYAERLFAQHLAAQPAPSTRMLYEKILRGEAG